jgi:hypothetical protein
VLEAWLHRKHKTVSSNPITVPLPTPPSAKKNQMAKDILVVEHLPRIYKALGSILTTAKKYIKKKETVN